MEHELDYEMNDSQYIVYCARCRRNFDTREPNDMADIVDACPGVAVVEPMQSIAEPEPAQPAKRRLILRAR